MDLSDRYLHYQTIRRGCYQDVLASDEFCGLKSAGLVLEIVSKGCIQEAAEAWDSDINWQGVLLSRNDRQPRNFDVAAYIDTELVGLAFGRVSKGKNIVRIDKIERKPSCQKLKGLFTLLTIQIASDYAIRLGASAVKVTEPRPELAAYLVREEIGVFHEAGYRYPYSHVHIDVNGK